MSRPNIFIRIPDAVLLVEFILSEGLLAGFNAVVILPVSVGANDTVVLAPATLPARHDIDPVPAAVVKLAYATLAAEASSKFTPAGGVNVNKLVEFTPA
jgi:hypothetical protein